MKIDLSIIIVSYNTKKLTRGCIESIIKFKPKIGLEVIVVDNGSTDGSVEVLRKLKVLNSNIEIVECKKNLGFAKANNQGMKRAKGEYVLLLNSDTKVTKGAIDKLIEFAKSRSDAGVIVPQLLNENGSVQASIFRFPTVLRNIRQWWFGERGILDKYYPKVKEPVEVDIAVMSAFLITPKALKKVGRLDGRYFMFYEDFDYCRRINRASLKVYYLPSAKIYHYHGASGKSLVDEKRQWYRLMHGSRIYHGLIKHYIIFFIQRLADVFKRRILRR